MEAKTTRVLLTILLASSMGLAQPGPPLADHIGTTCDSYATIAGLTGAVQPGARVIITDGDGDSTWVTAEADGSFWIGIALLSHNSCTYLLVSQEVGGQTSNAVPVHCDPPLVDFATPDWESVFAQYLRLSLAKDFVVDGTRVLVRPKAESIDRQCSADGASTLTGQRGTANAGSLVWSVGADGSVARAVADTNGGFVLHVAGAKPGDHLLVVQQFRGRTSRASVVR